MSEQNKAIVRRWLEEMDKHNFEIIDEVVSPDLRFHFPGNPTPMTFEEYKQFVHSVYEAMPDLRHKIEDLIAEGDSVVMRATDTATHKGEFMGVAPTGKEVTLGCPSSLLVRPGRIPPCGCATTSKAGATHARR